MSSRFRERPGPALLLGGLAALGATGCGHEARRFRESPPTAANVAAAAVPGRNPYEGNAWAVAEGRRFYEAYNCVGCHAHGGGGMGPALMDAQWLYGREPAQVAASILDGRPNGMPPFRDRISEPQVWQVVAYLRSMSGLASRYGVSTRQDHMQYELQALPSEPRPPAASR